MKTCTKCGVSKSMFDFHKDARKKSGFRPHCKLCIQSYTQTNKNRISAYQKNWYERNQETQVRKHKDWYWENRENQIVYQRDSYYKNRDERLKTKKAWNAANPDKRNAAQAKRRAAKLQATPPWLTKDDLVAIQQFYTIANQLTELNGVVHHVDHIIPLQGKTVCGLHVPWNLRVLEGTENTSKSNKLVLPVELTWG